MSKIGPKISKKFRVYHKNPYHDKKHVTYLQNPTVGYKTYWAPRTQMPQQYQALDISIRIDCCYITEDGVRRIRNGGLRMGEGGRR